MKLKRIVCMAFIVFTTQAWSHNGMIHVTSNYDFNTTVDRFTKALNNKGMRIFATIKHSEGAASVGVDLAPTTLIIFGNPKVGAPLMACAQMLGMDLPQKALITDEGDKVVLTYNDPAYLKQRHDVEGCDAGFEKVSKALSNFSKAATE